MYTENKNRVHDLWAILIATLPKNINLIELEGTRSKSMKHNNSITCLVNHSYLHNQHICNDHCSAILSLNRNTAYSCIQLSSHKFWIVFQEASLVLSLGTALHLLHTSHTLWDHKNWNPNSPATSYLTFCKGRTISEYVLFSRLLST